MKSNSKTDGMDQNLIYQNCNILGHDSGNYFQLIGYPKWWVGWPCSRGKVGQQGNTYGARGHGAVSKANATQASTLELEPNIMITDADKSTVSGLNGEQWQTLVNLLNTYIDDPLYKITHTSQLLLLGKE